MSPRFLFVPVALLLALTPAVSALAQEEVAQAEDVISYATFVQRDPYAQSVISHAGAQALEDIRLARKSLAANDRDRAAIDARHVQRALVLVRHASPSMRLADGIGQLHDRLVKGEGANPEDMTPIYGQLDAYAKVTEAEDVRVSLDRAKTSLGAGKIVEAKAALEEARAKINYVEIDIPVKQSLADTRRAIQQMNQNDWLGADATLQSVESHVTSFAETASISVDDEFAELDTISD